MKSFGRHILRDMIRRRAGFKIVARPKRGPATWESDGFLFTDEESLARARVINRAGKPAANSTEAKCPNRRKR